MKRYLVSLLAAIKRLIPDRQWRPRVVSADRRPSRAYAIAGWRRGADGILRAYAIAGWRRGADGIYRNGESTICRRGHQWVRDDGTEWPTLHAAIKQERVEPETPLLDQGGQE
jgi:hypothetical protein